MHKISIIGISGNAGSGKDTIADYLIDNYGFVKVSLADPFKRFCQTIFNFSDKQLWGSSRHRNNIDNKYTDNLTAWAEVATRIEQYGPNFCAAVVDGDIEAQQTAYNALVHWACWLRENFKEISPRIVLQSMGTEWGREAVKEDIWIQMFLKIAKKLLHEDGAFTSYLYDPKDGLILCNNAPTISGVVLSDIRYLNEFKAIRDVGGAIIRVNRPETDEDAALLGIQGHSSEKQQFTADNFDFILSNDKALKELYADLDQYMDIYKLVHH